MREAIHTGLFLLIFLLPGCDCQGNLGFAPDADADPEDGEEISDQDVPLSGTTWARTYGGSEGGGAFGLFKRPGGGYLLGASGNPSFPGAKLLWLDDLGNITLQRNYETGSRMLLPSMDGGLLLAGIFSGFWTISSDFEVTMLHGDGRVAWHRTLTFESANEAVRAIVQDREGNFLIAGDSDNVLNFRPDVRAVKLDRDGNIIWQNLFGGEGDERGWGAAVNNAGHYIIVGSSDSLDPPFGFGMPRLLALEISRDGDVLWAKTYRGRRSDRASFVHQTSGGGYLIGGSTSDSATGRDKPWLFEVDAAGTVLWSKIYSALGSSSFFAICPAAGGRYLAGGVTDSQGAGGEDLVLMMLDQGGGIVWQKTYGGPEEERLVNIQETDDGNYIVSGTTSSFGLGYSDGWVLKMDEEGTIGDSCPPGIGLEAAFSESDLAVTVEDIELSVVPISTEPIELTTPPMDISLQVQTQCSR